MADMEKDEMTHNSTNGAEIENSVSELVSLNPEPRTPNPIPPRLPYFAFSLAVFLADQASKLWAHAVLRPMPGQTIHVVPGLFGLSYAENPGIAFSLFGDGSEATRWLLFSVAVLATFGTTWYILTTPLFERRLLAALSCILGGIAGNATDRLTRGVVIDFLDAFWGPHHWPTFNVADSFICIGAGLLALDIIFVRRPHESPDSSPIQIPEP